MFAFVIFLLGHVTMVAITGFVRNMNHIVMGTDGAGLTGVYLGLAGVGVIIAGERARQLVGVAQAAALAARGQGDRHAGDVVAARPRPRGPSFAARTFPVLLGQRQGAHLRGVADAGGRQLQGLPAEGLRPRGEPGRTVSGGSAGDGREGPDHAAPLHPGLVGHRRMGRAAVGATDGTGPAETGAKAVVFYSFGEGVARQGRGVGITTVSRSRTPCTPKRCWPTR